MSASPEDHFPQDYRSARAAFIAAAEASELGVTSRMHPSVRGRDGQPLFLDTAWAGARDARRALLLISGTHGVEGYFGSGCQTGLLREGLAGRVPPGTKLVLLHALNPFGFSFDRRVNEDNADVNRNFVDHARPPHNAGYDVLAPFAAPDDIAPEAMRSANAALRDYAETHGAFALQDALSRGQYNHPAGIYFGGSKEAWSLAMLRDVFGEELKQVEELVVVDYHTGLGECGAAELITEAMPGTPDYAWSHAIWGDAIKSTASGDSLSAALSGTIDSAAAAWLGAGRLAFVALEVGTTPLREVFEALRKDNWLHAYAGLDHRDAAAIKRQIRAAFYPDTTQWKRAVWAHSERAVAAALAALAKP